MSTAAEVREHVEALPTGGFLRSADMPGSRAAVDSALSRIASSAGLVRVARGVYWKGVTSRFGAGRPDPLGAALEVAGVGAGPAGWTAAKVLGLTTQLPAEVEVAVTGRVPEYMGARFHKRNNLARCDLRPLEIGLLEVLRDWPTTTDVDWEELTSRVRELADHNEIDLDEVATAARKERRPSLRKRTERLISEVAAAA